MNDAASEGALARRWGSLGRRQRRLIVVAGAVEGVLKVAMLADLRRRDQSRIRGPKWLWTASTVINSAGLIPVTYFVLSRARKGR
jgi:hypothetical protein